MKNNLVVLMNVTFFRYKQSFTSLETADDSEKWSNFIKVFDV